MGPEPQFIRTDTRLPAPITGLGDSHVHLARSVRPTSQVQTSARRQARGFLGAMLRVTTLHASSAAAMAAYYARYLAAAPGEEPGVWSGQQAAGLGLSGEVTVEALELLLSGRDPVTGGMLGRELVDRVTAKGKVIRAVSGFDATFSAPKTSHVVSCQAATPCGRGFGVGHARCSA